MKAIEKISTGVPGLDALLYGGLPKGRSTLVTGRSGTAKSVLALQLACNFARRGIKTVLLSVEEAPEDLVSTAQSLDFDLADLIEKGLVHIADLTRLTDGPTVYSGEFDVAGLIHTVEAIVKGNGATAVILDSATALFSPKPATELMRSLFYQLVSAFRRMGLTAVITAEAEEDYGAKLTTLGVEDFICDLVLILRNLVDSERRRRSIEVHKFRRSRHYKGEYPFTITLNGLVVFPLDVTREADLESRTRFSSGVTGFDAMLHGGWRRDSIVLLRGPTGSGKTTLCGLYARAGAMRGEKVIYYGFEETKNVLLRNFAQLEMPLDPLESSGNLKVICTYPEATSPEDLLIDVRASLEQYQPSLVVFDSISSIEHSTSERGFRQFIVGLSALIREHSRSALLTQTISSGTDTDAAAPFLSTIPDAIVLLDYELEDDDLKRSIRILKMRGSAHATGRKKLSMQVGGLHVEQHQKPRPARAKAARRTSRR